MKVFIFVFIVGMSSTAFSHGGGLNSSGCHNQKGGSYHCHRSPSSSLGTPFLSSDENASINIARRWLDATADRGRVFQDWNDIDDSSKNEWIKLQASISNQAYGSPIL